MRCFYTAACAAAVALGPHRGPDGGGGGAGRDGAGWGGQEKMATDIAARQEELAKVLVCAPLCSCL
jgi:hypothetical protein